LPPCFLIVDIVDNSIVNIVNFVDNSNFHALKSAGNF
jgi:hypothetical protein